LLGNRGPACVRCFSSPARSVRGEHQQTRNEACTVVWLFHSLFVVFTVGDGLCLEYWDAALLVLLLGHVNELTPSKGRVGVKRGMMLHQPRISDSPRNATQCNVRTQQYLKLASALLLHGLFFTTATHSPPSLSPAKASSLGPSHLLVVSACVVGKREELHLLGSRSLFSPLLAFLAGGSDSDDCSLSLPSSLISIPSSWSSSSSPLEFVSVPESEACQPSYCSKRPRTKLWVIVRKFFPPTDCPMSCPLPFLLFHPGNKPACAQELGGESGVFLPSPPN
jgi:hypothetical protein